MVSDGDHLHMAHSTIDKYRAYLRDHLIHIQTSHVAHINVSCRTCKPFMFHKATSHVTHMKESCDTYRGVMSQI